MYVWFKVAPHRFQIANSKFFTQKHAASKVALIRCVIYQKSLIGTGNNIDLCANPSLLSVNGINISYLINISINRVTNLVRSRPLRMS